MNVNINLSMALTVYSIRQASMMMQLPEIDMCENTGRQYVFIDASSPGCMEDSIYNLFYIAMRTLVISSRYYHRVNVVDTW